MKKVHLTIDEGLLARLDDYCTTRGRSAVVREAVAAYLARKESEEIDRRLVESYTRFPPDEFDIEWAAQAVWPE